MDLIFVSLLAIGAPPLPPPDMQGPRPQPGAAAMPMDLPCEQCNGDASQHCGSLCDRWATLFMMPQTCYQPRYGCYSGNERHMHRYPAFHGHFYRRPYNYRNVFDYPWHAEMNEPTSHFSYHVPAEPEDVPPPDQPVRTPPRPLASTTIQPMPVSIEAVKSKPIPQPVSRRISDSGR